MPEKKTDVPASTIIELPAAYSQAGFVQVHTIAVPPPELAANDVEPLLSPLPAS